MINVGSFIRTLFNCSHWDREIDEKRRREQARRDALKKKISIKTEKIAASTRRLEAGAELISDLMKDLSR